jgi:cytochrome c-type biogenesis protein CcmH/NrfF
MFIAPCCWRENLLVHHSPKADELRAEIGGLIQAGRTDVEIRNRLVEQYTTRILAQLEGPRGELLSWTPVAAALAGLGAIGLFLQRSMEARKRAAAAEVATDLPELPESEWK